MATDLLIQSGEQLPFDGLEPQEYVTLFRNCSAQCLMLGNYAKPTAYTVDALLLYFYCELLRFRGTNFGLDIVLATIIRVAMRMGYHRDPSHYPNISIFAGEMRRRVWALLIQLDILASLQVGLPRLINERDSDTKTPRNIPEEEMNTEMNELPHSWPESGSAVPSYMRARMKLVSVLGTIHGYVTSVHPLSYDTVIQLHEMLNAQQDTLPASLKVQKFPPITDSAAVVMRRLSLDMLFRKSLCVLHRRYMKPQNRLSWETCIDAAQTIIHHQSYVYHESKPGGLLSGHLWKITYLATYEFLLASMLLCLALHSGSQLESDTSSATGLRADSRGPAALLGAMEESYTIWKDWSAEMKESTQVLEIVRTMLDRVKRDSPTSSKERPWQGFKDSTVISNSCSGMALILDVIKSGG